MTTRSVKFNSKTLKINTRSDADNSVFEEIFIDRDYKNIDDKITNKFDESQIILDIGAHTGMFSIYAATLNPKAKIYAFEPEEENFQLMKKNIKENRIKNIITKNLALSKTDGEITLMISKDSHNHSLYLDSKDSDTLETKKIRSTSLSRIFTKFRIEEVQLAKIDCEGAEFEILLETEDKILKKIKNFIIEYHQFKAEFDPNKLISRLNKLGFKTQKFPSRYDKRMGMILGSV